MSLKRFIRNCIILKYTWLLGIRFSLGLIRLGYLIKISKYYVNYKVSKLEAGIDLHRYVIESNSLTHAEFTYLEFGVSKGNSFNFWVNNCLNPKVAFYGFDTFSGIPEDWGSVKKGAYSANGILPRINDTRVKFIVGLFQNTLEEFISGHHENLTKRLIIHLDADLYSSTMFSLIMLRKYFKKGDIVIFDEFFSVTKPEHEPKAFFDFLSVFPFSYIPIAKTPNQLAIEIC